MNEQFEHAFTDNRKNQAADINAMNINISAQPGRDVYVTIDDCSITAIDRIFDQCHHYTNRTMDAGVVYIERGVKPRHGETDSQGFYYLCSKRKHYILTVKIYCMSDKVARAKVTHRCMVHLENFIVGRTSAEQLYAAVVAEFPVIEPTYC